MPHCFTCGAQDHFQKDCNWYDRGQRGAVADAPEQNNAGSQRREEGEWEQNRFQVNGENSNGDGTGNLNWEARGESGGPREH